MRIVPNKFLIILKGCFSGIVLLTTFATASAANPNPPPPTPVGPGLPIDGGIAILLLIGILFAFYKFNCNQNIKKC